MNRMNTMSLMNLAKVPNPSFHSGQALHQVGKALPVLAALLLLASVAQAHAPADSNAGCDLTWWTVDGGGGGASTGGSYSLGGTIGQPDAGPALAGGGTYTLVGGFWGGGAAHYRLHLPLVLRQFP